MGEPNTLSDDLIFNSIQETIHSQLGPIPEGRKDDQQSHEVNSSNPLHQIDDSHVEQRQTLIQKDDTQVTYFSNSSQIESIDEDKQKQTVELVGGLNMKEKNEGKKEKKPRKRGKGLKKDLSHDFERQTVCDCDKRGDRARVMYSREEIEDLRYVGMEEQKKKWIEVYCRLGSSVAMEYDNLTGSKHGQDENYVNFDPRPQFSNKKCVPADFIGNEHDNVSSEMENINQVNHVSGVNGSEFDGMIGGEEDHYEDEDSDSEYFSIQRPAFYVTGEPDFDSGPPQDGLEYLRRVRWEVQHIPKVKVAKVERNVLTKEQTVYMPKIPDIAACPEHLMPSKEWEDVFLADFSNLRLALTQEENSASAFSDNIESGPLAQSIIENVIQENLDLCQTDDTVVIQENLDVDHTEVKTAICDGPSLRTIMEMEPRARVTTLRKRITSMETMSSLGRNDCAWLFALCAAIDTPLDADTSASLRCLLRKCASLRAEKSTLDDELIMLNILATISGRYFGQLEII